MLAQEPEAPGACLWYRSRQQHPIDEGGLMAEAQDEIACRECMDLLADYVDGALPKHQAELLEWHLEGCGPCVAFVRTYKGTVDAAKRLRETTLPPELKEKLRAFLRRSAP